MKSATSFLQNAVAFLWERLKEPSTWAGLAAACAAIPGLQTGALICGAVAAGLKEKSVADQGAAHPA
ncbi:hypothetical protein SAMN02949497_1214 [Methylomagnum ishizawai]|uniref:Uncharacterized protein n=1 Tax=Methylomagnum ishizawai TaxID=1760988 RepID=A0A1Y6CTH6_9GAMM|nr:hypothetical protein [Methylomagnum ishizawai]SMF93918.1 hypothetical protein SAMN02949497_1214 [Methylomagnum ishizawai]